MSMPRKVVVYEYLKKLFLLCIVLSCREMIGESDMIFEVPCLVDRNMAMVLPRCNVISLSSHHVSKLIRAAIR